MTYDEFILAIENDEAPVSNLPLYIQALWWDAKGNWAKAHSLIEHWMIKIPAGCMLTCTGKKVIFGMQIIGTGVPVHNGQL